MATSPRNSGPAMPTSPIGRNTVSAIRAGAGGHRRAKRRPASRRAVSRVRRSRCWCRESRCAAT
ncbi:hypothetical protein RB2654_14525 [Rhodobacterales bacterium HTCC2654]|uniref:Uncharacterized protein n=1 Tax=Maritimibacter alkaliphilus HTCC2654 TaxID=314271 RepID=A3VGV4_9RHOB|nr:hypothetical protein RB2654_14525 [Rhodobacterales bacterium HTCC2654] [Maritimibacter alkaliphilus HTCC2654]